MSGRHERRRWSGSGLAAAVVASLLVVPLVTVPPAAATPPDAPLAGATDLRFGSDGATVYRLGGGDSGNLVAPIGGPLRGRDGELLQVLEVLEQTSGDTTLSWHLARTTADGLPAVPATPTVDLRLPARPTDVVVDPESGDLYVALVLPGPRVGFTGQVRRVTPEATLREGFGAAGVRNLGFRTTPSLPLLLDAGRLYHTADDAIVEALSASTGVDDDSFQSDGFFEAEGDQVVALAADGDGRLLAAVQGSSTSARLHRMLPDGSDDEGVVETGEGGYGNPTPAPEPGQTFPPRTGSLLLPEHRLVDLAVRPDGSAVLAADSVEGVGASVLSIDAGGALVSDEPVAYGAPGDDVALTAVGLDDRGRALAVGEHLRRVEGETPETSTLLARLGVDGALDRSFGQVLAEEGQLGVQLSSCGPGSTPGGVLAGAGRIVVSESCPVLDSSDVAGRLGAYLSDSAQIGDLVLTAAQEQVDAAPTTVRTADVPAEALEEALDEVATSPLRYSPLRYSPLRYSPLRYSPLRYSPLRYSPIGTQSLPQTTLAQVPLAHVPGAEVEDWDEVLEGTKHAGRPLQTVYVHEVLALLDDATLEASKRTQIESLDLERLDPSRTDLRDQTLAGLLLGDLRLTALPAPTRTPSGGTASGWCDYIGTAVTGCEAKLGQLTVLLLGLAGVDLEAWLRELQPLAGRDLGEVPLAAIPLEQVDFGRTALADLDAATLVDSARFCSGSCPTGPLSEATFLEGALLGTLLRDGLPPMSSPATSLLDLLAGVVAPEDVPWEALELDDVLDAVPIAPTEQRITYTATFTASCASLDDELRVQVLLPEGARYVPGSARLTADEGEAPRPVPVLVTEEVQGGGPPPEGQAPAPPSAAPRPLVGVVPTGPQDCGSAGLVLGELVLEALAPRRLEVARASAVVRHGRAQVTALEQAPVDVRDPFEKGLGEEGTPLSLPLAAETLTLGYLGREGAADYYRLPVEPGQNVTLTLSHLPADFDLLVYDDLPLGPDGIPTAVENTPLRYSPLRYSPLRYSPTDDAEASSESTVAAPEDLQGVPLLAKRLRAASAARGQQVEAVRLHVREGEPSSLVVGVVPFDGAVASTPYVLHASTDEDPPPPPCAGTAGSADGSAPGARVFAAPDAPRVDSPPPVVTGETQSLILVDRHRMTRLHGSGVEGADGLWSTLQAFAASPLVKGALVDVGADPRVRAALDALDADQCSVSRANEVVSRINQLVDELRGPATQLRFVTLIGDDEALPMGRVPDLTDIANQIDHAPSVRVAATHDNAVSRAFHERYLLSDDPYGALSPSAFLGTQLHVPDLAVGRLVETPTEIEAQLQLFLERQGVRPLAGSFVSSYDFLTDLGRSLAAITKVQERVGVVRNDDSWTRADAEQGLATGGLLSVNAHYDQYRALPADQDASGTQDDLLVANTHLPATMSDSLLLTVGCNAGLNLSDLLLRTVQAPAERERARTQDWAQRVTARGGLMIANTGFGYGDDDAIAYSERLVQHVAENLDGSMTLGQALLFAKHEFLETGSFGVYDHKAVQQATFYGLPQWRLRPDGLAPAVLPPPVPTNDVTTVTESHLQQEPVRQLPSQRGDWYAVGAEPPQVIAYRPVQPLTRRALVPPAPGLVAHGAVLTSLKTTDVSLDDPVISVPLTDLAAAQPEPEVTDAFFPTTLAQVVSRSAATSGRDALVLVAGQYRASAAEGVPGTQRLVKDAGVEVTWSGSPDFLPPQVPVVDAVLDTTAAPARVGFTVTAPDADTDRVVVLYLPSVQATPTSPPDTWQRLDLERDAATGLWVGSAVVPSWQQDVGQFLVQAVDQAGNVTTNSNKGFNYRAAPLLETGSFDLAVAQQPTSAVVTVLPSAPATSASGTEGFRFSVNAGPEQAYPDSGIVLGRGTHLVAVSDAAGATEQVLVVVGGDPAVSITTPAAGVVYPATGVPAVFRCTAPGRDSSSTDPLPCVASSATLSRVPGKHVFSVTSGPTTKTVAYTVVDPAALTVAAPDAATVTDPIPVSARVLRWDGVPLGGQEVRFSLGSVTRTAVTGADGTARTTVVPAGPAGSQQLRAEAAGGAAQRPVQVAAEQVTVTYVGDRLRAAPTLQSTSGTATLRATVVQPDDGGLGDLGRAVVTFELHGDDGLVRRVPATSLTTLDGGRSAVASATVSLPVGVHLVVPVVDGGWFAGTGAEVPLLLHGPNTAPSVTGLGSLDLRRAARLPAAVHPSRPLGWAGIHAALRPVKGKGHTSGNGAGHDKGKGKGHAGDGASSEIAGLAALGYTGADGRRWWFTGRTATQLAFASNGKSASVEGPLSVWTTAAGGGLTRAAGTFTWRIDAVDGKPDALAHRVLRDGKPYLEAGTTSSPLPLLLGALDVRKK